MANYLSIVKTLESTNISVRGLGQVVVDPATIEVGNNSVVARCRVTGMRGYKMIKCYLALQHRCADNQTFYPRSLRVYGISGRVEYVDVAIGRWIAGDALDVVVYRGGCDFRVLSRAFDIFAHKHLKRGVIHGDIKPENIIVAPSGKMTLVDNDYRPVESVGNLRAKNYGTTFYTHRHRSMRRTDENTDHYPLALQSAILATLIYDSQFLYRHDTMEDYIAKAAEILREYNDTAHYNLLVASQCSIMGKVEGVEELFESIVVAYE